MRSAGPCADYRQRAKSQQGYREYRRGYADDTTVRHLAETCLDIRTYLANNNSYHALKGINNLIITVPTGTNVNDIVIGLIDT